MATCTLYSEPVGTQTSAQLQPSLFFYLSKAFDTVWHRGLLAKVASFNIGGNVLRWLESYLSCRVQQVRVSGSLSQPFEVCSGVPQGSILGPLLFLRYVNDLTRVPNTSLYADDTTLVASELSLPMACNSLQWEIRSVVEWMRLWKLRPNAGKTVILCIPPHPRSDLSHIGQYLFHFPDDRTPIPIVSHHKHLGVIFDSGMSWSHHLEYLERRTSSAVGVLYSHMSHLPLVCRRAFYASYILPIILYCSIVRCSAGAGMLARLELMHRRILRAIFRFPLDTPLTILYSQCKTCPLQTIINRLCCRFIHQIKLLKAPMHIQNAL